MSKKKPDIKIAIAVPTYNEAKNIKKLAQDIQDVIKTTGVDCTLLIIDDNSPDGTGVIADKLIRSTTAPNFHVQVLHRAGKEGLGKAYVAGFKELLKQDFTHILQMDADFSHNPAYIVDFIREAHAGRDFVAASRYMPGGGIVGWTPHRRLLSLGGNIYTRLILGNKLTDYTNGFNLYTSDLLRRLDTETLTPKGYGFLVELKYRALRKAKNYAQIPIVLTDRLHGASKIPKNTIIMNIGIVLRLRFAKNI